MWNDTDIPLAYLITFRCYGTWLHGDERGSTDRFHNVYKTPHIPQDHRWHDYNRRRLNSEPLVLTTHQRETVESAIRDVCLHRRWHLYALNVRTNHVHVVVAIGAIRPERALNAFKAYATRRLRERNQWRESHSPWADKGSNRYLWTERSLGLAIEYVIHGQGGEPPEFDRPVVCLTTHPLTQVVLTTHPPTQVVLT